MQQRFHPMHSSEYFGSDASSPAAMVLFRRDESRMEVNKSRSIRIANHHDPALELPSKELPHPRERRFFNESPCDLVVLAVDRSCEATVTAQQEVKIMFQTK